MKITGTKLTVKESAERGLVVGSLYEMDGVLHRLLVIRNDKKEDGREILNCVLIDCESNQFRIKVVEKSELTKRLADGTVTGVKEAQYLLPRPRPGEEQVLQLYCECIKTYLDTVAPYYEDLQKRGFEKIEFKKFLSATGIKVDRARRYIRKYIQAGFRMEALYDGRYENGNVKPGVNHAVPGRKSALGPSKVLNDEKTERIFEKIFKEYKDACNAKEYGKETKNKPTLKAFYRKMISEYFSGMNPNGYGWLPENERPSYGRFYYWVKKQIHGEKLKDFATSVKYKQNNKRLLTGTAEHTLTRPGQLVEVDEHEIPVVLVSCLDDNHNQVVGSPIVYLAIDALTRCIVGFSVQLQVNNCYVGVMNLMDSMLMTDEDNAAINLSGYKRRVFPGPMIPEELRCDQGSEYTSRAFRENLTGGNVNGMFEGVPVRISLVAPGLGSHKGIVEHFFATLDQMLLASLSYSNGGKSHAHGSRHEEKAVLTIQDMRQLIYIAVSMHNNSAITGYTASLEVHENVKTYTPLNLWDYFGKQYGFGIRATVDVIQKMRYGLMLKRDDFQISQKQISYSDYLYYDITSDEDLVREAVLTGKIKKKITVRYDPRTIAKIYHKDGKGRIHEFPLAAKRDYLRKVEHMDWAQFEIFNTDRIKKISIQVKEKDEAMGYAQEEMRYIVEEAAKMHEGKNIKKNIKEAGKIEKQVMNAFDNRMREEAFGETQDEYPQIEEELVEAEAVEIEEEDLDTPISLETDFLNAYPKGRWS